MKTFILCVAALVAVTLTSVSAAGGISREETSVYVMSTVVTCTGSRGSFELSLRSKYMKGVPALSPPHAETPTRTGTFKSGTGQYAQLTGSGRWRRVMVAREGAKALRTAHLTGSVSVAGAEQRVRITMKGGKKGGFVLATLQPGSLKRDSGSQSSVSYG